MFPSLYNSHCIYLSCQYHILYLIILICPVVAHWYIVRLDFVAVRKCASCRVIFFLVQSVFSRKRVRIYWRYTLKFVLHLYMRVWLRTWRFENLLAVTCNLGVWSEPGSLLQYHWCSKCVGPQLKTSSFWKFLSTIYLQVQEQQSWSFKNSCSPLIVSII